MTVLSRIIAGSGQRVATRTFSSSTDLRGTVWAAASDKTVTGVVGNLSALFGGAPGPTTPPAFVAFGKGGKVAISYNFSQWYSRTQLNSTAWGTKDILVATEYQGVSPTVEGKTILIGGQGGMLASSTGTTAEVWRLADLSTNSSWDAGSSYNNDVVAINWEVSPNLSTFVYVLGRRGQIAYISIGSLSNQTSIAPQNWSYITALKNLSTLGGASPTVFRRISTREGTSGASDTGVLKYIVGFDNGKVAITSNLSSSWTVHTITTDGYSIDGIFQLEANIVSRNGLTFLINNGTNLLYSTRLTRNYGTPTEVTFPTYLNSGKGVGDYAGGIPNVGGYTRIIAATNNSVKLLSFQDPTPNTTIGATSNMVLEPGLEYITNGRWDNTSSISCLNVWYIYPTSSWETTMLIGSTNGEIAMLSPVQ